MNDPVQALRRLLAASEAKNESPLGVVACREFHAAMNEARQTLADIDGAAAAPADDYHSWEAA